MQELSDFELAQRRLEERQSKRNVLYVWLSILGLLILFGIASGVATCGALFPVAGLVGLITLAKGIGLYYKSPNRQTSREQIEQEMSWLFGENWQDVVGTQSYAFAQTRIRQRRKNRWMFLVHLLLFVSIGSLVAMMGFTGVQYGEPSVAAVLFLDAIWLLFLIRNAINAFPTRGMLKRRERKVGEALLSELQSMRPEKLKREDKNKRDSRYALSDDGELVELSDDEVSDEDMNKQKRS